mgnify:FL=1
MLAEFLFKLFASDPADFLLNQLITGSGRQKIRRRENWAASLFYFLCAGPCFNNHTVLNKDLNAVVVLLFDFSLKEK